MTRSDCSGSRPEQRAARHALQAVLAAGEGRLEAHEIHQLPERQRDHREVDPLAADRKSADDDAQECRDRHTAHDRRRRAEGVRGDEPRSDVCGGAKERGMAKGEHAAEAEQQVVGAGEHCEAQQLHHEDRIDAQPRYAQREQGGEDVGDRCGTHGGYSLPNNPAGRRISTRAMMMNTTMLEASG